MTRGQELFIKIALIILGVTWVIVASFNLKQDPAWLSVLGAGVVSIVTGWILIEK